jgi:hypothetical protein
MNLDRPAINQCHMQIGGHDDATIKFCKFHRIVYQSWGPLSSVNLKDDRIATIAAAHGVSTAQVALRWITQQGFPLAVSPGLNEQYAAEDLSLGSFTLTATEMAILSAIKIADQSISSNKQTTRPVFKSDDQTVAESDQEIGCTERKRLDTTVYHFNPASFGPVSIDMNTGDLHGDLFFLLRTSILHGLMAGAPRLWRPPSPLSRRGATLVRRHPGRVLLLVLACQRRAKTGRILVFNRGLGKSWRVVEVAKRVPRRERILHCRASQRRCFARCEQPHKTRTSSVRRFVAPMGNATERSGCCILTCTVRDAWPHTQFGCPRLPR